MRAEYVVSELIQQVTWLPRHSAFKGLHDHRLNISNHDVTRLFVFLEMS
jgi:hypothetical protein